MCKREKLAVMYIALCALINSQGCQVARMTAGSDEIPLTLNRAREIADAFLRYRQTQWGEDLGYDEWGYPVEIEYQAEHKRYLFIYDTPEQEKRLIGIRGIFVYVGSREARMVPQM